MQCKKCKTELVAYQQEYCSIKCGNLGRRRYGMDPGKCIVCQKPKSSHKNKCCSRKCSNMLRKKSDLEKFEMGEISERTTLKKYLRELHNKNGCFICDITTWQGKELPLELDHIDGDASNNKPDNLRILCPNCHSITDTWKARNKGSGRKALGIKLA